MCHFLGLARTRGDGRWTPLEPSRGHSKINQKFDESIINMLSMHEGIKHK